MKIVNEFVKEGIVMELKDAISKVEEGMKKAIASTERELAELRTGRANPKMVEGIHVDYYGTPTMIKDLASISIPEARMIIIQPWDASAIAEVEKAINNSNLGLSPSNDGKAVRLIVPQLSTERREEMVKMVKKLVEDGKVSARTVRKDGNEHIKQLEKEKKITEDQRFKALEDIQKTTDNTIKKLDVILTEKEKELLNV